MRLAVRYEETERDYHVSFLLYANERTNSNSVQLLEGPLKVSTEMSHRNIGI